MSEMTTEEKCEMTGSNAPLKPGDVIQIHPDAPCARGLRGRLAFVDEPRSFGCTAGVEPCSFYGGVSYVRLEHEHFTRIGPAMAIPLWVER